MLNRRYVLSRGALAAIASPTLNLPAMAVTRVTAPDPIFAALAAEERAQDAFHAAVAHLEKVEARWDAEFNARAPGYIVMKDGTLVRTMEHLGSCMAWDNPRRLHDVKAGLDAILQVHFPEVEPIPALPQPTAAEIRAFRRRVRSAERRLQTAINKRSRLEDECGITAAEAAYAARMEEAITAERTVFGTMPTTSEGAAALVRYMIRYASKFSVADEIDPALENLAAFLSGGAHV